LVLAQGCNNPVQHGAGVGGNHGETGTFLSQEFSPAANAAPRIKAIRRVYKPWQSKTIEKRRFHPLFILPQSGRKGNVSF